MFLVCSLSDAANEFIFITVAVIIESRSVLKFSRSKHKQFEISILHLSVDNFYWLETHHG